MKMDYKNYRFQLYTRSSELLAYNDEASETLVTNPEKGVTIKTSWKKIMHTNTSNNSINGSEHQ